MASPQRLTAGEIARRFFLLLFDFQCKFGSIKSPPVPLDDILRFLGLQLEFDNLAARFDLSEHLGFTSIETRQIFIDESLDPFEHPEKEGRLNYTIAHECGRWCLHRSIPSPHSLSAEENYWLEREANRFATHLLMPEWLIRQQWKAKFGKTGPLIITPDMEALALEHLGSRQAFIETLADRHAAELAPLFKVSREAMRIRLRELELLPQQ